MAIKEVIRYQTSDGMLHKTVKDAKSHVTDKVCEVLDGILRPYLGKAHGVKTATELYTIVSLVAKNYDSVAKLIHKLNNAYDELEIIRE